MCNLNIMMKLDRKKKLMDLEDLDAFTGCCKISFFNNNDAEGLFASSDKTTIKAENGLIHYTLWSKMRKSNIVIDHTRLSTHGLSFENTQPFVSSDRRFAFVHNGVMNITDKRPELGRSDSKVFFDYLKNSYRLNSKIHKDSTPYSLMIESVEGVLNKHVISGSYSIFIYDIELEIGYYFKNSSTHVHLCCTNNSCLLTTSIDNTGLFGGNKEEPIKPYRLYRFLYDENGDLTVEFMRLDIEAEQQQYAPAYGCNYPYDNYRHKHNGSDLWLDECDPYSPYQGNDYTPKELKCDRLLNLIDSIGDQNG